MRIETIYRVHVEPHPSKWLLVQLDELGLMNATEDLLTELHGLAVGSRGCESSYGTPASNTYAFAEYNNEQDAIALGERWTSAIQRRGFIDWTD